jgi:hypothetical protein
MGRKTYEPCNLNLENLNPKVNIKNINLKGIEVINRESGSDNYLCGGDQFAGWLLDNQKINFFKTTIKSVGNWE